MLNSEASNSLRTLKDCSSHVLRGLAVLAIDKAAFGNPENWTPTSVSELYVYDFNTRRILDEVLNPVLTTVKIEIMNKNVQLSHIQQQQLSNMFAYQWCSYWKARWCLVPGPPSSGAPWNLTNKL